MMLLRRADAGDFEVKTEFISKVYIYRNAAAMGGGINQDCD